MKKIISLLLCLCMIFGFTMTVFASESDLRPASALNRIVDGMGDLLSLLPKLMDKRMEYSQCKIIYSIPKLDEGFVPQGFCYVDSLDLFVVSYYKRFFQSILTVIDASSGQVLKTVRLANANGTVCSEHCGGVADVGDSLLISTGRSISRLRLSDLDAAQNGEEVCFDGTMYTPMRASYAGGFGDYLLVGQYYFFTPIGIFDSPRSHWYSLPDGSRNYAMCFIYDAKDLDSLFDGEKETPVAAISMPAGVQGVCYDGQSLYTSCSTTSFGSSVLSEYELDWTSPDGTMIFNRNEIPLCYIGESRCISRVEQPPMMEGIDFYNGRIYGIFENCAQKYKSARLHIPYICDLSA